MAEQPVSDQPVVTAMVAMMLCCSVGSSVATIPDTRPVIHLGMMAFLPEGEAGDRYTTYVRRDDFVLNSLPALLEQRLPDYRIETKVYRTAELVRAAQQGEVDLVFASSGAFASLLPDGIYPLATLVTSYAPDPNQAVAGALVVKAERADLKTIDDLRGLRAMSGLPSMFFNWQLPASVLIDRGVDPERYFAELTMVDHPVPHILEALQNGTVDVGLLRACVLEDLPDPVRQHFRVIDPVHHSPLRCEHTSRLFPNWTVGAMRTLDPTAAHRVAVALLTAPAQTEAQIAWRIANQFGEIDALYKALRWGRYEYLRHWTFDRIWEVVWPYVMAAAVALLGLLLHLSRVNALVRKRTAALEEATQLKLALEARHAELTQKFHDLERLGTMGMLSNMVAHEVRQPLSALRYALHTIEMVLHKEAITQPLITLSCQRAKAQTERINAIVDHVRTYAKHADRDTVVDVRAWLRETLHECEELRLITSPVTVHDTGSQNTPLFVQGNPLELKLMLFNLLKNSQEAWVEMQQRTQQRGADEEKNALLADPALTVTLACEAGKVVLVVEDGVAELTEGDIDRMQSARPSNKAQGLGLGLAIVKSIVEAHAGRLRFEAKNPRGLAVRIELPSLGCTTQDDASTPFSQEVMR